MVILLGISFHTVNGQHDPRATIMNGGGGASGNTRIQRYTVYAPRNARPTVRIHMGAPNYGNPPRGGGEPGGYAGGKSRKKTKTKIKKKAGDKVKKATVKKLLDKLMRRFGKIGGGWIIDLIWPVEIDSGGCIEEPQHPDHPKCSEQRNKVIQENNVGAMSIDSIPVRNILDFLVEYKKFSCQIDEFEYVEEENAYRARFKIVDPKGKDRKVRRSRTTNGYRDHTGAWLIEK